MKKRLFPRLKNGLTDMTAPFWQGDTAETILEERKLNPPQTGRKRSSRSPRGESSGDPRVRRLKRLERNLPRRKTLVARKRIEKEIKELQTELAL